MSDRKTVGQIAYEGYFKSCGGKSLISGANLPTWDAQGESIRAAWESAALDVVDWHRTADGIS